MSIAYGCRNASKWSVYRKFQNKIPAHVTHASTLRSKKNVSHLPWKRLWCHCIGTKVGDLLQPIHVLCYNFCLRQYCCGLEVGSCQGIMLPCGQEQCTAPNTHSFSKDSIYIFSHFVNFDDYYLLLFAFSLPFSTYKYIFVSLLGLNRIITSGVILFVGINED